MWGVFTPSRKRRSSMTNRSHPSFSLPRTPGSSVVVEHDSLRRYVCACDRANGAWHRVCCTAEALDAFLSGRSVSMVAVASGLLALSVYW